MHFARCWTAWVRTRVLGGIHAITSDTYLHVAEPFVHAFLTSQGGMGMGGSGLARPEGAFQGVLLLVDCEPAWAEQICTALHLPKPISGDGADSPAGKQQQQQQQQAGGKRKGGPEQGGSTATANGGGGGGGGGGLLMPAALPAFTRSMVPGGLVVVLQPEQPPPKGLRELLREAGPFTHAVVMVSSWARRFSTEGTFEGLQLACQMA